MAITLSQTKYRFGNDDGTEATHTFRANENTSAALFVSTNYLLRIGIQESGALAAANLAQQFQYNLNSAGWVNITTTSNVARAVAVAAFTNGQASTKRLTETGSPDTTNANCTETGSSGGTANDVPASGFSETVLGFQLVSGTVARGDTVQFRVTISGPTTTIVYTVTPSATVSGNLTLACASGSRALSGTAVTTKASRTSGASPGTLSLSGINVTLTQGGGITNYLLVIAAGNRALSGSNVALGRGYKVFVSNGSLAFTGTAVAVRAARKIGMVAGAETLSGTGAALVFARKMAAGAASRSWTGTATSLKVGYKMGSNAGALALLGTGAGLSVARPFSVASGAFTLAGTGVGFVKSGSRMSSDSGDFTFTGTAVGFLRGRVFSADPGSFIVTGTEVVIAPGTAIVRDYWIDIQSGAYGGSTPSPEIVLTGQGREWRRLFPDFYTEAVAAVIGPDYRINIESGVYGDIPISEITMSSRGTVLRRLSPKFYLELR